MRVLDRLRAAGLGLALAAAVAFQAYQVGASWGGLHAVPGAAIAAVVGGLALLRGLSPLRTALAGLSVAALAVLATWFLPLPAEPSPATSLGLAVLVATAVRTLPARTAAAVAAAGLAVVAGGFLAAPASAVPPLSALAWLAAVPLGLVPRLLDARRHAAAERVRQAVRLELARELHDVVAHHVTGIVLQAQAAQLVTARHPDRTADSLAGIESAGSAALAATRRVVGLLRDTGPVAEGHERLEELVEGFDGRRARLRMEAEPSGWPPEVSATVYRIVREALTNVARHAPRASTVTVTVTEDGDAVTVEVADDAPRAGVRGRRRPGYGLVGMRERLEALGGTLAAGPRPGSGWSVHAVIPTGARR
ncbi:sensor histidine kinase [Nonomuraea sp. NPDC050790]|uniref:sensor histidine kinase n=1 Tax=Nonomuraea sp. NPDC050790 TaxID=3364371 RepID=UPI0037B27B73